MPVAIKILKKKKIEGKLLDIGLGNDFLNLTPKATKANINKWDWIKPKTSVQQRKPPTK